jgi:hypothetical protein
MESDIGVPNIGKSAGKDHVNFGEAAVTGSVARGCASSGCVFGLGDPQPHEKMTDTAVT